MLDSMWDVKIDINPALRSLPFPRHMPTKNCIPRIERAVCPKRHLEKLTEAFKRGNQSNPTPQLRVKQLLPAENILSDTVSDMLLLAPTLSAC